MLLNLESKQTLKDRRRVRRKQSLTTGRESQVQLALDYGDEKKRESYHSAIEDPTVSDEERVKRFQEWLDSGQSGLDEFICENFTSTDPVKKWGLPF